MKSLAGQEFAVEQTPCCERYRSPLSTYSTVPQRRTETAGTLGMKIIDIAITKRRILLW